MPFHFFIYYLITISIIGLIYIFFFGILFFAIVWILTAFPRQSYDEMLEIVLGATFIFYLTVCYKLFIITSVYRRYLYLKLKEFFGFKMVREIEEEKKQENKLNNIIKNQWPPKN